MIEICKLLENYEHKRRLDDDTARQFVDAVECGLSIDAVIEIMADYRNGVNKEIEIKRFINNDIVRRSAVCCAALGIRSLNHDTN